MSIEVIEQAERTPEELKAYIDAQNRGEAPKPAEKPAVKTEPVTEPEVKKDSSRSMRREMNRLREELGAARALADLAMKKEPVVEVKVEVEPKRAEYPAGEVGSAEFLRATMKWDQAQATKAAATTQVEAETLAQNQARWKELDAKTTEDVKLFPDWAKVMKASQEDEDAPEIGEGEHPVFMGLLIESDVRAFVAYHFAKHPDELQAMLDLSKTPDKQIRAFHRLEGRLEKEYAKRKAAQASGAPTNPKDREHPAEAARPGGTAAGDSTPAKPKPSSEVAARGGSPAPDEPAVGSPAWMLKQNQAQYGH